MPKIQTIMGSFMLVDQKVKGLFGMAVDGEKLVPDRRSAIRETANSGAFITFQNQKMGCEILDISDRGARIRVSDGNGLPKFFELHTADGEAFLCEVKRRKSDEAGVQFLG